MSVPNGSICLILFGSKPTAIHSPRVDEGTFTVFERSDRSSPSPRTLSSLTRQAGPIPIRHLENASESSRPGNSRPSGGT